MVNEGSKVVAHSFQDVDRTRREDGAPYWRDVGTLDAYYEANLDLCNVVPQFNLYDKNWPIYTLWHNDPPAKTVLSGEAGPSAGGRFDALQRLGGLRIARPAIDPLQPGPHRSGCGGHGQHPHGRSVIGEGAVVRRAIIDKWTQVPAGARIGVDLEEDRQRFTVTESGIVCVPRGYDFNQRRRADDDRMPTDSDFAGV